MNGLVEKEDGMAVHAVFAQSDRAVIRTYRVAGGATVSDIIRLAAADAAFAGVDVAAAPVGVFGVRAALDLRLTDGDRVEFYRPLPNDPKQARRARVQKARRRS